MTVERQLEALIADGLERSIENTVPCGAGKIICEGEELVDFSSNDYLGLAIDPLLGNQLSQRALVVGVGSRAARLLSGSRPLLSHFERSFARMVGKEGSLLFNSGYHANLGIMSAITEPGSMVFSDSSNHASIVDGCRLCAATVETYPHCDLKALEAQLVAAEAEGRLQRKLTNVVVTEGIFSMDGDRPDFERLVALKDRFGFLLYVDEAHGFGATSRGGLGACNSTVDQVDIYLATFGKAAGVLGAAVATTESTLRLIRSRARPFIFSTALPPALVATLSTSLELLEGPRGKELRLRLADNVLFFRGALKRHRVPVPESVSHILPIVIGDETAAMGAARALRSDGVFCRAIRYPTVAKGEARLRFSLSAIHQRPDLTHTATVVARVYRQLVRDH
jgi:8-amino-7-oxononanoate synthase